MYRSVYPGRQCVQVLDAKIAALSAMLGQLGIGITVSVPSSGCEMQSRVIRRMAG